MNTAESNPYATSMVANDEPTQVGLRSNLTVAGIVIAGLLGALSLLVVAASIYEIIRAPAGWRITNYVTEGTLAALFAIISGITIHQFKARHECARVWLMICPLLLVIWVYPGTFTVLSFFRGIIGL